MVRVTVRPDAPGEAETPSAKIVAAARKSFDVVDELGRTITLRRPSPLSKLDFTKASGGSEINLDYKVEVMHLQYVSAIDGEPVATPGTEGELRALYARLDEEGNAAAQAGVYEHFLKDAVAKAATEAELKNS